MEKYDVIIIGAGPAGLRCAEVLSNSNLKILLVEKNKAIGPKICAGGITQKDLTSLKIPEKLIEKKFKKIKYCTPLKTSLIKSDNHFILTIDRKDFGQWQLSKLNKSKIKIIKNAKLTNITKVLLDISS